MQLVRACESIDTKEEFIGRIPKQTCRFDSTAGKWCLVLVKFVMMIWEVAIFVFASPKVPIRDIYSAIVILSIILFAQEGK
jgi:hypothetical protein